MFTKKLEADIKTAMKAKDMTKLTTLRGLKAEAGRIALDTDKRKEITSDDVMTALTKGIKQRNDSIKDYVKGGREDLADAERLELTILEAYLPKQMTADEIETIVDEAISSTGATTKKEMGKVMGAVMKKIPKGTADNSMVSKLVGSKLS